MRRVDALFGSDVADVDHAFDAFGELHERAELGEIRDPAFDGGADLKALPDIGPGIAEGLLESERNAAFGRLHLQDDDLDGLTFFDDVAGFADFAFRPGHFRDVNQAFDARFEFDEGAELHQTGDGAAHAIGSSIFLRDSVPGMRLQLFQADGNAALVAFVAELENFYFELLPDGEHVRGLVDAGP